MRVVVTGENDAGVSVIVDERQCEAIRVALLPGMEFVPIFGTDVPLTFPSDGAGAGTAEFFPKPGGYKFWTLTIPARTAPLADPDTVAEAMIEFEAKLPGVSRTFVADNSGMAKADVVEWVVVVAGRIVHELSGGQQCTLAAGDSLVQIGTTHRWVNEFDEPCTLLVATISGVRGPVSAIG